MGLAVAGSAQPASGPWTLEQCLEYGMKNHPAILGADAAVRASMARIGSTRSGMGTKITAQSGFTRNKQEYSRARALAAASKISGSDDLVDSTANSISIRKTIADAGRTSAQLTAANKDLGASRAARTWQEVTTAVDIKTAYFMALQAMAQVEVQQDLLRSFEEHLVKVRGFVEVGTRAPYDITKAMVDVANTKVAVIKAQSQAQNALSQLTKAVGYEGHIDIASQAGFLKLVQPELDSARLIEEALDRPDLTQAQFQVDSAQQRLSAAQRGMKPTLSGSAGYDWSGTVTPLDRSWSVGMQLSMPVLDGKLTRYSIDEQRSNLEQVRSTRDQRRLAVRAEVETAITGVRDAFHRLEASEVLLKEAGESLSLAEGRFDAGLGSPIEITDARAAFSSARGSHVTAYYDSLIALTNLDQVLGLLPAEAGGLSGWTAGAVTDEPASEPEPGSISANITTAASGTIEINQETARVSSESIVVPTATDTTDTGSEVKR